MHAHVSSQVTNNGQIMKKNKGKIKIKVGERRRRAMYSHLVQNRLEYVQWSDVDFYNGAHTHPHPHTHTHPHQMFSSNRLEYSRIVLHGKHVNMEYIKYVTVV